MKNLVSIALLIVAVLFAAPAFAQSAKTVKLEQVPGDFSQKELKLKAGKKYVFEISNNGVDHEVGFGMRGSQPRLCRSMRTSHKG